MKKNSTRYNQQVSDDQQHLDDTKRHALIIGASSVLTKLADLLSSSKIVLIWSFASVGAPAGLLALFAPTRESLSMLPQIFLSNYIKQRQYRKGFWVGGSIAQSLCIAGMIFILMNMEGIRAGLFGYGLLIAFSLSRAVCSLTMKDILGKTVAKDWRGRVTGNATSISSFLAVLFALVLYFAGQRTDLSYLLFLAMAVLAWLLASILFSYIDEPATDIKPSKNEEKPSLIPAFKLLKNDQNFRHFIIARGLLICSAIIPVFIVIEMHQQDTDLRQLAVLLIVSSLGSTVSSRLWGSLADRSARLAIFYGALITGIVCFFLIWVSMLNIVGDWLFLIALFFAMIGHSGIRVGRKTYVVNVAKDNKRTDYVAVSNTLIGCLLLLAGGLISVFAAFSVTYVFMLLAVMAAAGAYVCSQLQEA